MSRTEFDLARIINPISTDTFFAEYWETAPLVIPRQDPGYYAELLSIADIDHILTSTGARYPTITLVKDGNSVPFEEYTTDLPWGRDVVFEGLIQPDKILSYYEQGTSIVIQALHRSWKPLALFCRNLERYFSAPVQTNIYLTPKGSQGFLPHYDTHDVFVLQIAGTKHWRLYGSPVLLPNRAMPYSTTRPDPGKPIHEFDLNAGDLIYMPRGFIHEGLTSDESSLHITLGIVSYTWLSVLHEVVALCQGDIDFRRSLPVGFSGQEGLADSLATEFAKLTQKLMGHAVLDKALNRIADRFHFL